MGLREAGRRVGRARSLRDEERRKSDHESEERDAVSIEVVENTLETEKHASDDDDLGRRLHEARGLFRTQIPPSGA